MGLGRWWRDAMGVTEAVTRAPAAVMDGPATASRRGYEVGIPAQGITLQNAQSAGAGGDDRSTVLADLHDAHLACPWSVVATHTIARAITAGGVSFAWDQDDGEGDQDAPAKPTQVRQCERLIRFTNAREDIIQLLRSVIIDLLVFGDAFIEVVWAAGVPVALYSLDCPSTTPLSDTHGNVTGYVQITEQGQRAVFDEHEVVHISLDSPRSGVFGVSPTFAALVPIRIWLFAAATLNELFRKGLPAFLHVDHPASMKDTDQETWVDQHMTRNVGVKNIGRPVMTKGGGQVTELQPSKLPDILASLDQQRDVILSTYGVPPAEAGVIETGNIGGGTGDSQHKSFMVNTCAPIAALVMEKLNYLLKTAFGIDGWSLKFDEVDLRDSQIIEQIADLRIKNGSWTLNRARAEIGEPAVDGGNIAILLERTGVVAWRDMDAAVKASVAKMAQGTAYEPDDPGGEKDAVTLSKPEKQPVPAALAAAAGLPPGHPANPAPDTAAPDPAAPSKDDEDPDATPTGRKTREHAPSVYHARIREALSELHSAA